MIRLVDRGQPKPLSIGDAREAAKSAYAQARAAQRALVAHLHLTELLHRPGNVSYYRLKGELAEARRQAERAQAVVDALAQAVAAMEATDA